MKTKRVTKAKKPRNPLDTIIPFLEDPRNTEILIDGHQHVQVVTDGKLTDVPSPFKSESQLMELIQAIAEPLGRRADESHPILDLRLQDGSRVHIVIPPISLRGPAVTIRKATIGHITANDLVEQGTCSQEMIDFLDACVKARLNILVAGGTNSGKSTVLAILANMIPDEERIVLLQHNEILLKKPRLVQLETRPANLEGRGEITMRQLVSSAVNLLAERIVTQELTGPETLDILQAMNSGFDGCIQAIHATSTFDALVRLEEMVSYANPSLPTLSVRSLIASAVDVIVFADRLRTGQRRIMKISEVTGLSDSVVTLRDIFEFRQLDVKDGHIEGDFPAMGNIPKFMHRMQDMGIGLPISIFTPKTK
ncbi:MAG TPA: ATPase, T2SS/T4P/T4SS family [Anaerolineales bacterium]|nr:ATPase, T2SS/T4P/T4SS family [Anaerolineales bacterium]